MTPSIGWPASSTGDADPERQISHIYGNRRRIATRIRLLQSGLRYSQTPTSPTRRLVSNIEIDKISTGEYIAGSNFLSLELSIQAQHETHLWGGRIIEKLRQVDGNLKMFWKQVLLTNTSEPLPHLTFLI